MTRPEANRHAPPREGGSRVQHLWVAGVDGCRGGWFAVLVRLGSGSAPRSERRLVLCGSFSEVVSLPKKPAPIAVDIPMACLMERSAAASYVIAPPASCSDARGLAACSPHPHDGAASPRYREAMRMNGAGMSRQAFNIMGKIGRWMS